MQIFAVSSGVPRIGQCVFELGGTLGASEVKDCELPGLVKFESTNATAIRLYKVLCST